MEGYVISLKHDEPEQPNVFWSGTAITSEINDSSFFTDLVAARQAAGTLQTQYFDRTVEISKARKGIQLVTVPTTTNVATGI